MAYTAAEVKSIDKILLDTFQSMGIPNLICKILLAQARWETAHYSTPVFLQNNNIGGIKFPGNGNALGKGIKSGKGWYANYASLQTGAKDLGQWYLNRQSFLSTVTTVPDYVAKIKNPPAPFRPYFEGDLKKYQDSVSSIFRKQLAYVNTGTTTPQTTAALTPQQKKTSFFL